MTSHFRGGEGVLSFVTHCDMGEGGSKWLVMSQVKTMQGAI
jgi:hypothetical protein